ncbi:MAG: cytochrome c biogenesis protein CcdA [Candidatus Gastranaerophilales bacterium]|nr:cytochrome c biogenesis protein CcdA [Candidatus Gastranaerophilales bacterium]
MDNLVQVFSAYSSGNSFILPILLAVSFFAGVLSSLTPCSLGMLPLIIGYVGGYSKEGNKKLLIQMLSFSFGLSLVLSIIGVICALTGRAFTSFATPIVLLVFSSIIIILGLNLVGFIDIQFPTIIKKMPQKKSGSLFIFPFLIGTFFALASSPCSSPILASIMAIATISTNALFSIALLFFFALGQCIIVIIFALFTSTLKHMNSLAKYTNIIMKISGVLLILTGVYILYSVFSSM